MTEQAHKMGHCLAADAERQAPPRLPASFKPDRRVCSRRKTLPPGFPEAAARANVELSLWHFPPSSRPRPHLPQPAQSRPGGGGQACWEAARTRLDRGPAPRGSGRRAPARLQFQSRTGRTLPQAGLRRRGKPGPPPFRRQSPGEARRTRAVPLATPEVAASSARRPGRRGGGGLPGVEGTP